MEPTVKIVNVTPEMAEHWLKKVHPNNRNPRPARVARYRHLFQKGKAKLTTDAVGFDTEGYLINAIHRLTAIVISGVTVPMIVVRNLPTESFMSLDSGAVRTTRERFKMAGYSFITGFEATIRALILRGGTYHGRALTLLADETLQDFAVNWEKQIALAHQWLHTPGYANSVIRAVMLRAILLNYNHEKLKNFAYTFSTGFMVPGTESAVLLRNFVTRPEFSLSAAKPRSEFYRKSSYALYNYLCDKEVPKLLDVPEELFPLDGEQDWFN